MNKMRIIPTKQQWKTWTLPSKATYISVWIGAISLLLFVVAQSRSPRITGKRSGDIHQTATGKANVQVATTGDNSPITITARKEELSHKIQAKQIYYNKPVDSLFITKVELYSKHPIPNVYFAAYAKSIVEFYVRPRRTGMHIVKHSGKHEDFWFTNIPNFGGKYLLVVKTKKSEKIKIEYDFE